MQFRLHIPCVEPNQELQIDFGGPIFDKEGNEVYLLTFKDRFSKKPTACLYGKTNAPHLPRFYGHVY